MKNELSKFRPCSEALRFREQYENFQQAWEKCPRGDWMLWIALRAGVNKRKLTLAKALCAETVRHLMNDKRSIEALKVSMRYGRYRADESELKTAADAAYAAAYDAADTSDAAYAAYASYAAYAAYAASGAADAADAADADADAASDAASGASGAADAASDAAYAASGASGAADAARKQNRLATAKICRKILTDDVLRLVK